MIVNDERGENKTGQPKNGENTKRNSKKEGMRAGLWWGIQGHQ